MCSQPSDVKSMLKNIFIFAASGCVFLANCNASPARKINLGDQDVHFQGDILMRQIQVRGGVARKRAWQGGIIYYELADYWSGKHMDMLAKAMKEIQDNTCIRFQRRTKEDNYIRIVNGTGCYSYIGQFGGSQDVSLSDYPHGTCWVHETVVHELLHAVGLHHEQMRPDRDEYLYVFPSSVDDDKAANFDKCSPSECNTYGVPYNYLSVMHYDVTAFSKEEKVTMLPRDIAFANALGHSKTGHPLDYEIVRRMYDCPKRNVTCFECEGSPGDTDCASGTCVGDVCYTAVLNDKIVKGCGDIMHTFIGCRNGAQVGGCNTVCACRSDHCNRKFSLDSTPALRCIASLVHARCFFMLAFVLCVLGKEMIQ